MSSKATNLYITTLCASRWMLSIASYVTLLCKFSINVPERKTAIKYYAELLLLLSLNNFQINIQGGIFYPVKF